MQGHSNDSLARLIESVLSKTGNPVEVRGEPLVSAEEDGPSLMVLVPSDSCAPVGSKQDRLASFARAAAAWAQRGNGRLVLVSSGAVYGPDHRSTGFVDEAAEKRPSIQNTESEWWIDVESAVLKAAGDRAPEVLILRPPAIAGAPDRFWDRLLHARFAFPCVGFDPSIQLITAESLAECIQTAIDKQLTRIYNVAPDDVAPLSQILRRLGIGSLALPDTIQLLFRSILLKRIDGLSSIAQLGFHRHSSTISGEKFARDTGVTLSTREALQTLVPDSSEPVPEFDRFGCDESFIAARGKTVHRFFEKIYWRVERRGLENIPESGPALIVGPHRGFMPLDAVILLQLITSYTSRLPRFLIHPTLVKFPFQARFFRRLGGLIACQKNGEWVLERGGLLGVFPEGIEGTFKLYRDVYNYGRFGWRDYIQWSLKHRAPIVPFTIVGSAEIFPILYRFKWNWFKKFMEWPFFPITPTFPLLPFPLPSKWHVQFLPAIYPDAAEAEALETGQKVEKLIANKVRDSINAATQEMRSKQRSIFWGSIFDEPADQD